jgi:hypothetical protein
VHLISATDFKATAVGCISLVTWLMLLGCMSIAAPIKTEDGIDGREATCRFPNQRLVGVPMELLKKATSAPVQF